MSWIGATLLPLLLSGSPTDSAEVSRAGVLVDPGRPDAAVVLLSSDRAWAPEFIEGISVCSAEPRCAPVAEVQACEAPGCPFDFGAVYVLAQDIVELDTLAAIDEATLVALEAEPSLRPLIAKVRAQGSALEEPPASDPPPSPPPRPTLPPPSNVAPLPLPSPEPPPEPPPEPEWTGWNGTVGWSLESTITPALGVFFDGDDEANFAVGGVITMGFHHQFPMLPSRGPRTPKGAKRQRPFFVGWIGNNLGADLVLTTYYADQRPLFGIAAEFAARGVYNRFGDGMGKQGPSRLRVMSMLDHLIPMPGLVLDARGNPRLDVRFGGPVSILVRQNLGVEARLDLGFHRYGGPTEGYILVGVGLLGRRQLSRGRPERRTRPR